MTVIPKGFRLSGYHCGIKHDSRTEDIAIIVADAACVAAGVYTLNQIVAAPVVIDRERTPSDSIRAIVVNSGNANACTGPAGMANAERMLQITGEAVGCDPSEVLVMSTGIIGQQLPMTKIELGIRSAADRLGSDQSALDAAARGFITTDTRTKIATGSITTPNRDVSITGIAKGSGMIGPNMATMLGAILTDAMLPADIAQQMLRRVVQDSFNSISVDGHTSTNDTVLLLASGQTRLDDTQLQLFEQRLHDVCVDLAKQIVNDGEGASHVMEIVVRGTDNSEDARVIASAIANSPLVKTAIAGNDPNWGRIVSAAGYAGPKLDAAATKLVLNGTTLYELGSPAVFDASAVSRGLKQDRNVMIELTVGRGTGAARFWTCDLTHEYVTINADYHT
jgi:glutamate N-acetyltransferase/amino-acid N-acetyltransferase